MQTHSHPFSPLRPYHHVTKHVPVGETVVVAEADSYLREALVAELEMQGYHVVPLLDGHALSEYLSDTANNRIGGGLPKLVICSHSLPHIDGAEICKRSRASDESVPFIVLVQPGQMHTPATDELIGKAYVIDKPINLEELKDAVVCLAGPPG